MPKIELPPTKSSLRKLKEDLSFAYEGYDLLNQKREILAIEIVRYISEIRRVESEFSGVLDELYAAYRIAAVDMGSETITLKSSSEKRGYFFHMKFTKLMGLNLSKIRLAFKKPRLSASLTGTTATYDTAKERSTKVLEVLAEYATTTKSIIILSKELKKVQRRVNALEKIFIPQHEEARKYISDRIEEMERDEIFVKKLIRQRASKDQGIL
ncbi:MAG: V-type ATP synthase subunit D [Deltaproteobacteria bacterium]|nr:V-type ATP synthase subunit D [Deltaproteobacteria bacterium]